MLNNIVFDNENESTTYKPRRLLTLSNAFIEHVFEAISRIEEFFRIEIDNYDFVDSLTTSALEGALLLNPDRYLIDELTEFENEFNSVDDKKKYIDELIKERKAYELLYCYALYKTYNNYNEIDILLLIPD